MSLMEYGFTKAKIDKTLPLPSKRKENCSPSKEGKKSPLKDDDSLADIKESSTDKSPIASSKGVSSSPPKLNLKKLEKPSMIKSANITRKSHSKLITGTNVLTDSHSNKAGSYFSTHKEQNKPPKMKSPSVSPDKFDGFSTKDASPKCTTPSTSSTNSPVACISNFLKSTHKENHNQINSNSSNLSDVALPAQRVKLIMKSCPDVDIVPQDALFLISKATEFFIHLLVGESLGKSPACTLDYDCVSRIVHSRDWLCFLKETIPKKITWAEAQNLMAARKKDSIEDYL